MRLLMPSRPRAFSACVAIGAALSLLSAVRPAAAEETFPGVIQNTYGGTCAPQCTLCHNRPEGGPEHYNPSELDTTYVPQDLGNNRGQGQFFANLIHVNRGLPNGESGLTAALKKLATLPCSTDATKPGNTMAPCDSDGDSVPDMKEFAQDPTGDPNLAHGDLCIGPTYGCGATITPLPRDSTANWRAAAVLAALGLGIVVARRLQR
jgi:hypothetical protein